MARRGWIRRRPLTKWELRSRRLAKKRLKRGHGDKLASEIRRHEAKHPFRAAPTVPRIEDIEGLFGEFASAIGGVRGSNFNAPSDGQKSADFVLPAEKLIIEVKTLEASLNYSEAGAVRLRQIFEKLDVPFAEFFPFLTGQGPIPTDIAAEMFRVTRQNLRSDVRKAYKQLQSTSVAVGDPSYRRVLLIANSGVSVLPEISIFSMLSGVMWKDDYWSKGVEAVVFFSGNIGNSFKFSDRVYRTWLPMFENDDANRSFGGVLDLLGTRFLKFLSARSGEPDQTPMFLKAWSDVMEFSARSTPMRPKDSP